MTHLYYLAWINWGKKRWGEVVFESFVFLDLVSSFSDQLSNALIIQVGSGPIARRFYS